MRRGIGRGDNVANGELEIPNGWGGIMKGMGNVIFLIDFVDSMSKICCSYFVKLCGSCGCGSRYEKNNSVGSI